MCDLKISHKAVHLITTKVKNLTPAIEIHTWGGYGSQLYGLYLTYYLESRYPFRRTRIIVHTSGVTRRPSEISKYKDFDSVEVDDFKGAPIEPLSIPKISRFRVRKLIRLAAIRFGFLSESNTAKDLHGMKPWVLALRGHYTEIQFEDESLGKLFLLLSSGTERDSLTLNSLGIQYRLGDLVTLENKGPVRPELVAQQVNSLLNLHKFEIKIYSDSGELALKLLSPLINSSVNMKIVEATAEQTINMLSQEEFFIGTSSKISVWVAVFRSLVLGRNGTYMPQSFEKELRAHGVTSQINYF